MRQCMPNEPWQRGRPGGQCKHGRPSSTLLRTSRARTPHLPHAGLRQTENLAASSGASSNASTRNFWQVANSVEVTKSTDLRELDRVLRGGREAHKGSERGEEAALWWWWWASGSWLCFCYLCAANRAGLWPVPAANDRSSSLLAAEAGIRRVSSHSSYAASAAIDLSPTSMQRRNSAVESSERCRPLLGRARVVGVRDAKAVARGAVAGLRESHEEALALRPERGWLRLVEGQLC